MKRCKGCREKRGLEDFHRHPRMKDGYLNYCKDCISRKRREHYQNNSSSERKRVADWQRGNRDRAAAAVKRWTRANPQRKAELNRRSDERHPEKAHARRLLTEAVREGRIEKPDHCEDCGDATAPRNLHGHHDDYGKPLEVRWLCRTCHAAEHT